MNTDNAKLSRAVVMDSGQPLARLPE